MRRIYLILEVKSRELDSRILFSVLASQKNYSVVICKKAYLFSKLKYLKPGIVILKSMGKKNHLMILEAKKYGHKICLLDEEGLLFWTPEIYCRKRIYGKVINLIEYIFTWGKKDFDAIAQIYPNHRKKLKITGNPRIDLLHKKYRNFYKIDSKIIKEKFNEFILINTNFGYSNHITYPGQTIIEGIKKSGINDEEEINFHKNKLDAQTIRFETLKNFIKNFAISNKDKQIIIRPHQSEDDSIWNNIFKNYKNVKIIRDGKASISWMLASKIIISCNCTTGVEAKILGIDSLNFIPGNNIFSDYILPNIVNTNIYELEDLNNSIKKIFNKKKLKKQSYDKSMLYDYINNSNDENKSSIELILTNIDHLFKNIDERKDKYINLFSFMYFYLKRYFINFFMKKNYKKNNFSKLLAQKIPATSIKAEIEEKLEILSSLNNQNKPKVKEIYPDVYCIE